MQRDSDSENWVGWPKKMRQLEQGTHNISEKQCKPCQKHLKTKAFEPRTVKGRS